MKYTDKQHKILATLSGNLRIIACAGSGKTEVISRRIAEMISLDVEPKKIVCFSFTKKAAEELRSRILRHIKELELDIAVGEMFIGTIHSFCLTVLKEFNLKYNNYEVIDENSRFSLLSNPSYYGELDLKKHGRTKSKYRNISIFCESIDIFREELIDKNVLKSREEKIFLFCLQRYLNILDRENLLDFSQILIQTHELLKNLEILSKVKEKFKYLVCDEFQDINRVQFEIIKMIWGDSNNICVVGDDDQSIYHWRGTNVDYFIKLDDHFPDLKTFHLSKNFRCTKRIIKIAEKVIETNKRLPKEMDWNRLDEENNILLNQFRDENEEAKFIVEKIKNMIGKEILLPNNKIKKLSYGDFAILYRSVKNSAKPVIDLLQDECIKFIVRGGVSDLFEFDEALIVSKCFSFLTDLTFNNKKWSSEEILKSLSFIIDDEVILDNFKVDLEDFKTKFKTLKTVNLTLLYFKILRLLGIHKGIFTDSSMSIFGQYSELLRNYELFNHPLRPKDLKFFLGYLDGYAVEDYESTLEEDEGDMNSVIITTIHRAKGLQFPFVFIPSVNEKVFPTIKRAKTLMIPKEIYPHQLYIGDEKDERRLFYVAITRAVSFLSVSCTLKRNGKDSGPSNFYNGFKNATDSIKNEPRSHIEKEVMEREDEFKFLISPTKIESYLKCPYRYKINQIYHFRSSLDPALGYGNQLHFIIEYIFKSFKSKPDKMEIEKIITNLFFLRFTYGTVFLNMKNKACEIIIEYFNEFENDFDSFIASELEFFIPYEKYDLKGIVDLLLRENDNFVNILDFKATKSSSVEDFFLQLGCYSLGMQYSYKYEVNNVGVHFLTENKREILEITKDDLSKMIEKINNVVENIKKNNFPSTKDRNICKKCDFKEICPYKIGKEE